VFKGGMPLSVGSLCTVNRGNFEQQGNFEHQLQKNKNIPNFPVVVDILLR